MNPKLIKFLILLTGPLFLFAGCSGTTTPLAEPVTNGPYNTNFLVGSQNIFIDVATTTDKMELGLSGRAKLSDQQGMLFDFGSLQSPGFWMKDMNFDLDFIWIAKHKIIGLTSNVPTPKNISDKLLIYNPPSLVDQVLEVNAGWAEKYKIKVGDTANYLK